MEPVTRDLNSVGGDRQPGRDRGGQRSRARLSPRHDPPGRKRRGTLERSAETEVLVQAEAPRRAFPPPKFVHLPGESWRSRLNSAEGKVEVNSGHPDYQTVRKSASRRWRYLGRLYAKEVVLHNFGLELVFHHCWGSGRGWWQQGFKAGDQVRHVRGGEVPHPILPDVPVLIVQDVALRAASSMSQRQAASRPSGHIDHVSRGQDGVAPEGVA